MHATFLLSISYRFGGKRILVLWSSIPRVACITMETYNYLCIYVGGIAKVSMIFSYMFVHFYMHMVIFIYIHCILTPSDV